MHIVTEQRAARRRRIETSEPDAAASAMDAAIGMRMAAGDLRARADMMIDANDRDAVMRIASGYENRADEIDNRRLASMAR